MCHSFLSDRNFFQHLLHLDELLASEARAGGCPYCGGRLDGARYPRKPRGVGRQILGPDYEYRLSLCCSREGCRRRTTPGSVRFLGRRIYLGVVVVLITVLSSGVSRQRAAAVGESLGVSARTLQRWRRWWRTTFVETAFWRSAQGRLPTPIAPQTLPSGLWVQFTATTSAERLTQLLVFIAPVSTVSGRVAVHTD